MVPIHTTAIIIITSAVEIAIENSKVHCMRVVVTVLARLTIIYYLKLSPVFAIRVSHVYLSGCSEICIMQQACLD